MNNWEEALFRFFSSSCEMTKKEQLGLELEHFVLHRKTKEAVSYSGQDGVRSILVKLMERFPGAVPITGEDLIGFVTDKFSITLEPAAQLEISVAPASSVTDILSVYRSFYRAADQAVSAQDCMLAGCAYQPVSNVDDLELIPKERYRIMDRYFQGIGHGGREMMRGTAAMQVSIDYADEEDFRRKIQSIYYYSPLLKLLCDTSDYLRDTKSGTFLRRTDIWHRVDPLRCGILPGIFSKDYGFYDYIRFLGDMPTIFIMNDGRAEFTGTKTVREIYGTRTMDGQEIEHILSMAFPDVRLKKYLEIRAADSVPPVYIGAYCALIKGLFYDQVVLDRTVFEIHHRRLTEEDILLTEKSLRKSGWSGSIYGEDPADAAGKLLEMCGRNLDIEEGRYLQAFEQVIRFGGIANIK